MSERQWTTAQRQAIHTQGGDILVTAAAGSGKTAVLTERVLTLVADREHPVDIDRLLIVTFSNAAAEEMRQRIARRLYEKMEQEPENAALRRQSLLLGNAEICTIHSFCSRLIRENFQVLGLPGDMTLGRDGENELLQAAELERLLNEEYQKADPLFMQLIELFSGSRNDSRVAAALLQLYGFMRNHPFYREWAQKHIAADSTTPFAITAWSDSLMRYAREQLYYASQLLGEAEALLRQSDDEVLRGSIGTLLREDQHMLLRLMELLTEGADWDQQVEQVLQASFPPFPRKKWSDEATKKRVHALRQNTAEIIRELKQKIYVMSKEQYREDQAALAPLMDRLRELMLEFDSRYTAAKLERRKLDFCDLEHYALQLLVGDGKSGPTPLAAELGSRYAEIMLDEYQDTSFLQERLFEALTAGGAHRFMVGDVKQSIYSFREACPDNFLRKQFLYRQIGADTEIDESIFPAQIALNANFRTRREITGFINRLFRRIMTMDTADMDYRREDELEPMFPYDYSVPRPVTAMVMQAEPGTSVGECRRMEAEEVAKEVARLLQEGFTVEQDGTRRPLRPGDICILMRNVKNREQLYIDALQARGIGAHSAKNENLLETREVRTVVSYLAILANPMLDLELAEVLTSPMYGFTGDDLAVLRSTGRKERLYRNLLDAAGENARFAAFLRDYERLRAKMQEMPTAELIEEICTATGYREKCRVLPEGAAAVANLRLLQAHAADHEADGRGENDFAQYLRRLTERRCTLPSAAVSAGDAVTVLTIHRSKGLEFPVVFLVGNSERFRTAEDNPDIAMDKQLGFACKKRDNYSMRQHKTLPLIAIQIQNKKLRLQEEMRILYVALTRAREKLYLTAAGTKTIDELENAENSLAEQKGIYAGEASCRWDWLRGTVVTEQGLDLRLIRLQDGADSANAAQAAAALEEAAPDGAMLERLLRTVEYKYPYHADTVTPRRVAVSELAERAARERYLLRRRPKCLTRQEATAAERGNAAHRVMQFADLAALKADPEKELRRLVAEGYLYREDRELTETEMLARLMNSPLGERMLAADRIWREVRFLQEFTPEELTAIDPALAVPGTTLIMGAVDAVLAEGGHAVLVDYKTDRVEAPEELVERYALQVKLYAAMVQRQLGLPVQEAVLYSFRLGKPVKVAL